MKFEKPKSCLISMYSKLICSVTTILFISNHTFAISSGGYEIPKDSDTIQSIGQSVKTELPRKFKLLNWNIEKAKQGEVWANDFSKLQKSYDLVLIQEAASDEIFLTTIKERPNTIWNYFISWVRKVENTSSGLMIGSDVRPTSIFFARTVDFEPIAKTPKLTGFQTYKIQGLKKSELLVANIHAINFVSTKKFERHIQQVMDRIDLHQGPVIFVGDMNTWNKSRLELLFEAAQKRNLIWYDFERPDVKGMFSKLDHIFIRGLKVNKIKSLTDIRTSDHYPISAELEIFE